MTKPKSHSFDKPIKKKPTKQDLQKLLPPEESQSLQQPKRRLRKVRKHQSSDQDFVPGVSDNQASDQDNNEIENDQNEQFDRFKIQNDADIQEQKQKLQQKKRSKKNKNNQQIDKFIKKMEPKQKKQEKKKKQEIQVQTNIQNFFKKKQLQKKQNKKQPTPQVSQVSEQDVSDDQYLMRAMHANQSLYSQINGTTKSSEAELIQKATKLSLQSAKRENIPIQQEHININDFQFQNVNPYHKATSKPKSPQKEIKKPTFHASLKMQVQKPKPTQKHQEKRNQDKKPQVKPPTKKGSAKKHKQENQGPLGDETILFTGQFQPYSKDQITELCQKLGATIAKSCTKGVTVLLQGAYVVNQWKKRTDQDVRTTAKSRDAEKKGVKIVANNDIDDYFIEKTGKTLQEHFRKNPQKLDGFVDKQGPLKQNLKMQIQISDPHFAQKRKKNVNFGILWTEKYKPNTLDEVIGQGSQIKQLREWLQDWEDVVLRGNKKDVVPNRGFLPTGTINSRAALLSGDPGLGKTTTARLLAQQLNYNITQFNASDIRNKKGVQLLETNSLGIHQTSALVKNLVIMDEVDGMSKGDRGGITEIIQMIKNTTVPIICICNDRQSQKIRSLAGHCFDIRFHKPHKQLIIKRLKQIIEKQGGQASDLYLSRLVETFQNDMRQILNYLQLAFNTKASQVLEIKDAAQMNKFTKDSGVMLTNFEAARKLLNRSCGSMRQRMECYFIDSDFVPLMVHQNYLSSIKKNLRTKNQFHKLVKANDAFVLSDLIDTRIRKENDFSLMPVAGFMSSVYPCQMVAESIGFPQFPSWLGKFSSQRKHKRLLKELRQTIHCQYPSTFKSVRFGIAEVLYQEINFLLKHDKVEETLDLMETYGLSPIAMNEILLEVQYNPQKNALLPDVTSSTKTKLTKAYNRRHEQAKMKGKTKKGAAPLPQHHKYNEIMDEMSDDDFIVNDVQEEQNQNSQMNDENKEQKKGKKKATKAPTKKK